MGKLALWGGIAGAGQGLVANAESRQKMDLAKMEEQKQERMQALAAQYAVDAQQRSFGQQEKMAGIEQGDRKELLTEEQKGKQQLQSDEIAARSAASKDEFTFKAGEGQKDRDSREKIAQTAADARTAAKGASGRKRWESKVVKTTDMSNPKMPVDKDALSLFDNQTGRTYNQEGDKFFPQGGAKPTRFPARSEVDKLIANPDQADNFLRTYKYLPMEFFNGIGVGTGSSSAPEPDSEE